jgi:ubiquinol-cytochrome c reductase cytochrome b subunit
MVWLFAVDWLILTWLGGAPAEEPYVLLAQIASVFYFAFFIVILPVLSRLEYWLIPVPVDSSQDSANPAHA